MGRPLFCVLGAALKTLRPMRCRTRREGGGEGGLLPAAAHGAVCGCEQAQGGCHCFGVAGFVDDWGGEEDAAGEVFGAVRGDACECQREFL